MIIKYFHNRLHKLNTAQIIALGFAGVIFVGGIILWLPFCTAPGERTTFTDAIFSAATSVCVTGLSTVVMATHWTGIGKAVILILIQIGGIGLVSLGSIVFLSLRKRLSMRNRRMIQESYNLDQMSGLVKLVRRVVVCVMGAEAVGALFYAVSFVPMFGWVEGLKQSVFTSVSAFCNAGIDILGENSLADYAENPMVNFTTMGLIIAAGLGFTVWWDLWDKIKKLFRRELTFHRFFKSLRLHSKIVIVMTLLLVLGGTVLIFLFEYGNPDTIGNMPFGSKLMAAAFQSVTTRTAGFFTVDQAALRNPTILLCLFLMFVGGSPMGTAGGIKTTTLAVLVLSVIGNIRGKRDVEIHNRRIRESYIHSATVVTAMGMVTLLIMSVLLAIVTPKADLADILYELTSALATVGLSRGMTPNLPVMGKWIVIFAMYLGRIGPLTLGTAVVIRAQKRSDNAQLAVEDIMIG